jgi:2-aminoethylphosphonate-pyruvate transaminase
MTRQRLLLTPGPLTTSLETRRAMLDDWGSREPDFIALTAELRRRLLEVVNAGPAFTAAPLQGSGTFVVEAALSTLVGPDARLLVLTNGAYGQRIISIARRHGREVEALTWPEDRPVDPDGLRQRLSEAPRITHVAVVHCETTTGLLNPLAEIADAAAQGGAALIVDAMSSFGALPIDLAELPVTALLASSNKCLEGVPGLGFAVMRRDALAASKGASPSLALDLHDQWRGFEANGQWRFTPPVQVVAALVAALRQLEAEGGPAARLRRYAANFAVLSEGMRRLGYAPYLEAAVQSPIIGAFRPRPGEPFDFDRLHNGLRDQGFVIYPGKLTKDVTFRIGCIGAVQPEDIRRMLLVLERIPM